jgi:CHAT domain-containing protein
MPKLKIAACIVVVLVVASAAPMVFSQTTDDSGQIAQLITRFFDAYGKRDLAATMAFWDPKSPEFSSNRERFSQLFAQDRIELTRIGAPQITVEATDSQALVETDIGATDIRTGLASEGFGEHERRFDLKKVDGVWRIERYVPSEQQLADLLLAAKSVAEQSALVAAHREMVTPELIRILNRAARRKATQRDKREAIRLSDFAIDLASGLSDKRMLGWAYLQRGQVLYVGSDYSGAIDWYQRALERFRLVKDTRGEAAARNDLGGVYSMTGRYVEATREFQETLRLAKKVDTATYSDAISNLGEMYRTAGNLKLALQNDEEGLRLAEELHDLHGIADSKENTAALLLTTGDFEKALGLLEESLKTYRELGDPGGEAVVLGNEGVAYDATARYDEALKIYQQSLAQKRLAGDKEGQASTLLNIGNVMFETGKSDEALARYKDSYDIALSIGSPRHESDALGDIGGLYSQLGRYGLALTNLNESLKIDDAVGDKVSRAETLLEISGVYNKTGRASEALANLEKSILIFKSQGLKIEEAKALSSIAVMRAAQLQSRLSESEFKTSLDLENETGDLAGKADTLTGLSDLYLELGRLDEAVTSARQAVQIAHGIGSPALEAAARLALAKALQSQHRSGESLDAFHAALDVAENIVPEVSIEAHTGLGELEIEAQRWNEAADECEKALDEIDPVQAGVGDPLLKLAFSKRQSNAANCRVAALIALQRNEEAFKTTERSKARSLLSAMGGDRITENGFTSEEKDRLKLLGSKVQGLSFTLHTTPSQEVYDRLVKAKEAEDALRHNLYLLHPEVFAQPNIEKSLALSDTAALLPDSKRALLEYVVGEKSSLVFVIRRPADSEPPTLAVIPLSVGKEELEKSTGNFREELVQSAAKLPEAGKLYDALIAPAEPALKGVSTLGIVPDESMWGIPFSALRDHSGQYLVRRFSSYYAPSLTSLLSMEKLTDTRPNKEPRSMFLVGNPTLGPSHELKIPPDLDFKELPATGREVTRIAALAASRGIRVAPPLTGMKATKSRVKSAWGQYALIHLATHGFYDDINPLYSGVLLAQDPKDTAEYGVLEAREVMEQDLKADLVVLSACDTARGKIYGGEGPVGLSWSLFAAGTPATLLTQWHVDEEISDGKNAKLFPTATLMESFYKRWGFGLRKKDMVSKSEALQQAQQEMLHSANYAHPHFWAPFVLIGDSR